MSKRRQRLQPGKPQVLPITPPTRQDWLLATGGWVVTGLAFLAPFIGGPGGPAWFFEPMFDTMLRRLVLFGVGGLLLALMVLGWARDRKVTWRAHWLDLPVGLFFLGVVISAARSPYPYLAFFGPLWNQIALPFVGTGLLLYIGVKHFARTPRDIERIAAALVLAGGIVAIIGLCDRFSGHGWASAFNPPRLASILRNPMFTGLYLAMLVPLGVGVALATMHRWLRWTMVLSSGLMAIAMVLTLSRSAWVGFAAAVLLLGPAVAWHYRGALPRPVKLGAMATVAALIVLALLIPPVRARLRSMTNLRDATVQSRLVYMQSAWNMFRARPLAGWGVGTFTLIAPEFRPATNVQEGGVSINRVAALALPHNLPLQTAAETGLLGVVPFLLLALLALGAGLWLRNASPWQWGMTWGLAGMACAYLVTNLFAFDVSITLANAWIGFGLLAAVGGREWSPRHSGGTLAVVGLYSLAILLALGTLVWTVSDASVANATLLGTRKGFGEARAWARKGNAARCLQSSEEGIALLTQALRLSPAPCFVSYRYLALAYRERMLLALAAGNLKVATQARDAMFRYGKQALGMMDRDPEMQLFLCIEYVDYERFPDTRKFATEGRAMLKQLLTYLPNSAQAHLLQAKMLAFDKNLPASRKEAEYALTLDPSYSRAYLWLARIQTIQVDRVLLGQEKGRDAAALVRGQDPAGLQIARDACSNYEHALQNGARLDASDRMKYTTMLFLTNQPTRAVTEGRLIDNPREKQTLCDRISYFYAVRKQSAMGQFLIAQLQQPSPKPVSPRQPEVNLPLQIPMPWQHLSQL